MKAIGLLKNPASVCLLAFVASACDPISSVYASAVFPRTLDDQCVLVALNSAEIVIAVDRCEDAICAIRILEDIPEVYEFRNSGSSVRKSFFGIYQRPGDDGASELELSMGWIGGAEPPEFEGYVQESSMNCSAEFRNDAVLERGVTPNNGIERSWPFSSGSV